MYNDQSRLRALLHDTIERLCQRYKLTLSLAICLCLGLPVHAKYTNPVLTASMLSTDLSHSSKVLPSQTSDTDIIGHTSNGMLPQPSTTQPSNQQPQTTENVADVDSLASANVWQSELSEPSLYALLDAEFAADRGDAERALTIYKQQSFKQDATPVFERALSLSLRNENVENSLQFAKTWQDQNPDHVPA